MSSDISILLPNFLRPDALEKNLSLLKPLNVPVLISVDKYDGDDVEKLALNKRCLEISESAKASAVRTSVSNLGCRLGVEAALDWATDLHDSVIVIEDDLDFDVSALDFFSLLLTVLPESDDVFISGNNFSNFEDFHWTSCMHIWGWACTSASWKKYRRIFETLHCDVRDLLDLDFDYKRKFDSRDELLNYISVVEHLGSLAGKACRGQIDTWEYQLAYYVFLRQLKVVAPSVDLFANNGFDAVATHTTSGSSPKHSYSRFHGFPRDLNLTSQTWTDISLDSFLGSVKCPVCETTAEIFGAFEGGLGFPLVYRKCVSCGHLFVRNCSWIDVAYAEGVDIFDQGAVSRCMFSLPLAYSLSKQVNGAVLDYGSGSGLLARLLRDLGCDAYSFDRYTNGTLNPGFCISELDAESLKVHMIIAIEVLEHITDIDQFVGFLNKLKPEIVLTSTSIHTDQTIDWNYIDKNHCQHISIFSRKSIKIFAQRIGMQVQFIGAYQVFFRPSIGRLDFDIPSFEDLMGDYQQMNYLHAAADHEDIKSKQRRPIYL